MKQHFQVKQPEVVYPVLSLEEEVILLDNIGLQESEAQMSIDELNRIEETCGALEDVLVVSETMPEEEQAAPTDATKELLAAVAEMAVGGTEADASDLSMESLDGVKDKLKQIWHAIRDMLKRMWGHIAEVFGSATSLLGSYSRSINQLSGQISRAVAPNTTSGQKLKIANSDREGKAAKSIEEVQRNWQFVREAAVLVLGKSVNENVNVANRTTRLLNEATVLLGQTNRTGSIKASVESFLKDMQQMQAGTVYKRKTTPNDKRVFFTEPLPGGWRGFVTAATTDSANSGSAVAELNTYLRSNIGIFHEGKKVEASEGIDVPNPDQMVKVLAVAEDVLDVAMNYLTREKKKLDDAHKHIEGASEKLVNVVYSVKTENREQDESYVVQSLLRLNKHYAISVGGLAISMLKVIRQQAAAIEAAAKQCIKIYESDPMKQ